MLRILEFGAAQPFDLHPAITYEVGFILAFCAVFLPLIALVCWAAEKAYSMYWRAKSQRAHAANTGAPVMSRRK